MVRSRSQRGLTKPNALPNTGRKGAAAQSLETLIKNIGTVLLACDENLKVLQTKIPTEFHESQPFLIGSSFLQFISDKSEFPSTSVKERLDSNHYRSIYPLYHDIRLSAFILLHQLEIGSDLYIDIDRYYKFSTEFIIRESFRLNIEISELQVQQKIKDDYEMDQELEGSDFEQLLSQDFVKISTSYTLSNREAYFLTTQNNIPLFSSFNQRSSLDKRVVNVPDQFLTTKVLPHSYAPSQNTLSSISPLSNRISQLSDQSQQILNTFLHPNWYSLPTAKWLEKSDLQSFAPTIDEQNTVVTSAAKARLWLEHVGYKKLLESIDSETGQHSNGTDSKQEETTKFEEDVFKEEPASKEMSDDIEIGQISLENLYEWAPGNKIDEDEIEAFENGTEQQFVNELLSKLQGLKENRITKGIAKPSTEEIQIYHKLNRILAEIVNASDKVPGIKPSGSIPILQTEYSGTLPVPTQAISKKKHKSRR